MKKITITFFCTAAIFCVAVCNATDLETVAVIGTGDMGDSLGPRFAELGYRVVYGSRNPESDKVKALVRRTGFRNIC
jgi:lactate dehydrogenase-like 2-hydroxyacid dehydrogenase